MWSHLVTTVSSLLFHKQITWGEPSLDARYTLLALGILLLSCFYPFFYNLNHFKHFQHYSFFQQGISPPFISREYWNEYRKRNCGGCDQSTNPLHIGQEFPTLLALRIHHKISLDHQECWANWQLCPAYFTSFWNVVATQCSPRWFSVTRFDYNGA